MFKKSKLMWSRLGWVVAAVLLATSGAIAQQGATAQQRDMVLEGGTLIDGTGRAPTPDAVIVVEGNRIKAVGKRGQVAIPANANVINLAGRTILPGLIDFHTHLQEWQFPMFLPYGVTTIADLNNDTAWILAQREALKSGKIKGPRLFVAGTLLYGTLSDIGGGGFNASPAHTVEEARAQVRSRVADGVDIIWAHQSFTDDQLRAIIEETNRAGLPLLGHTQNIHRAASMGFKFEEHTDTMARALLDPDEKISPALYKGGREAEVDPKQLPSLVDYLVKHGVYLNPTLMAQWVTADTWAWQDRVKSAAQLANDPQYGFVPAEIRERWRKGYSRTPVPRSGYDIVKEYIREYSKAGGKILVGTDTGYTEYSPIPGLGFLEEMQLLANIGVPPMKVIQGATLWNAELLKKDKDLGSVEPGKLADFDAIEGNPLADMGAIRNVRMVIKDGRVLDTKLDPKWVNPIPQPYSSYDRVPGQIAVSPAAAHQGGQAVTLQIKGANFVLPADFGPTVLRLLVASDFKPNSIVRFDNADLPTHFVSSTELTATLDPRFLLSPGSHPVYVVTPGPHGNVTPAAHFLVNAEGMSTSSDGGLPGQIVKISKITPEAARQGVQTTVKIEGTNFTPSSVARFGNADLPTHFVSSTALTATLDARALQALGSYPIYVLNPGPHGNVSRGYYFLVNFKT